MSPKNWARNYLQYMVTGPIFYIQPVRQPVIEPLYFQ